MKLTVTVLGIQVLAIELATPDPAGMEVAMIPHPAGDDGGSDQHDRDDTRTPFGFAPPAECVPARDWDGPHGDDDRA